MQTSREGTGRRCDINDLPVELLSMILSELEGDDLKNTSFTCHLFRELAISEVRGWIILCTSIPPNENGATLGVSPAFSPNHRFVARHGFCRDYLEESGPNILSPTQLSIECYEFFGPPLLDLGYSRLKVLSIIASKPEELEHLSTLESLAQISTLEELHIHSLLEMQYRPPSSMKQLIRAQKSLKKLSYTTSRTSAPFIISSSEGLRGLWLFCEMSNAFCIALERSSPNLQHLGVYLDENSVDVLSKSRLHALPLVTLYIVAPAPSKEADYKAEDYVARILGMWYRYYQSVQSMSLKLLMVRTSIPSTSWILDEKTRFYSPIGFVYSNGREEIGFEKIEMQDAWSLVPGSTYDGSLLNISGA